MLAVPATRNQHDDASLRGEEADLLIEAVSLLRQHQQEAEERALAVEQRQGELEQRLAAIESRLAEIGDQAAAGPRAGEPEDRLTRLRGQVEELRGSAAIEHVPVEPQAVVVAETMVVAEPAAPSPSMWQRIERLPRNRLDTALLVLGALAVVYASLWQIALALGFS
jgi:hypothetical protein